MYPITQVQVTVVNQKAHMFDGKAFPVGLVANTEPDGTLAVTDSESTPIPDGSQGILILISNKLSIFVANEPIAQEELDPSKMFVMENPKAFDKHVKEGEFDATRVTKVIAEQMEKVTKKVTQEYNEDEKSPKVDWGVTDISKDNDDHE